MAPKLSNLFYRLPRLTFLAIGFILVTGVTSLLNLPMQEDPTMTERYGMVETYLPGASAIRVEALITEKVENALREVPEVKRLSSTSRAGHSIIQTELFDHVDKDDVTLWYVQAYSMVNFLYREHSRMKFKNFCRELRNGLPVNKAVWKVYRFRTLEDLQTAWLKWLSSPAVREKFLTAAEVAEAAAKAAPKTPASKKNSAKSRRKPKKSLEQVDFNRFRYRGLVPDK